MNVCEFLRSGGGANILITEWIGAWNFFKSTELCNFFVQGDNSCGVSVRKAWRGARR